MESLQGYFLIATPQMPDPRFQEQVVYICAHTEEGAMGLVVNKPFENISLIDIFRSADIPFPENEIFPPAYMGGPVEMDSAFFLYSLEYEAKSYIDVGEFARLSRDPDVLRDIANGAGPEDYIFLLGYAGWAPGQLEKELTVNGWLTLPAEYDVLFKTPDESKWKQAAMRYGIDISLYGDEIGTA